MKYLDLRPFIPTTDLELSKEFYKVLGFVASDANDELTLVTSDGCAFFLYKHSGEIPDSTHMFQLVVSDVDQLLLKIKSLNSYDVRYEPVKKERWGRVIYLWGPSNEMWHVTELAP